jgi:membrane protease YdiL (CAAX protease family)
MRKPPRFHREPDHACRGRPTAVAGVCIAGAGLLGASFSTKPGSAPFYVLSLGAACTWLIGGLQAGGVRVGREHAAPDGFRAVVAPIATGVAAFGFFYGAARIAHRIPVLNEALSSVLRYAQKGSNPLVMLTALANGVGEEVFFRGAVFTAVEDRHLVLASTAIYTLTATATRNPALMLASAAMGVLFGLQRRATGGIQAPVLTHLTWSTLMLRFLPPVTRRCAHRPARAHTLVNAMPI